MKKKKVQSDCLPIEEHPTPIQKINLPSLHYY